MEIYHDHIASTEFINLKRLWKGEGAATPVLNLDFLINHVMRSVHPLDWDAVVASDLPLKVCVKSEGNRLLLAVCGWLFVAGLVGWSSSKAAAAASHSPCRPAAPPR